MAPADVTERKQAGGGSGAIAKLAIPLTALIVIPVAPVLAYGLEVSPPWVFVAGAVAIGVLLNVSFGSLAELILAFFVLVAGNVDVVRAQITGSIIGTSLFGLGLAIIVGSFGRTRLRFSRAKAGQMASMLTLVSIALLLCWTSLLVNAWTDLVNPRGMRPQQPASIDQAASISMFVS